MEVGIKVPVSIKYSRNKKVGIKVKVVILEKCEIIKKKLLENNLACQVCGDSGS